MQFCQVSAKGLDVASNVKIRSMCIIAKGREEFGEKYGPIVVGSIALSDIILLLSIGVISEAILDDSNIESYLLYFVIMAVGPLIAFGSAMLMPNSEEDLSKLRKIKKFLMLT